MSAIVVTAASPRQQPANAAVTVDPITEAKLKAADQLHKARRFDEAIAAYQSTLDAARLSGNGRVEGWSLIGLGNVFLSKAMYPQARDYALHGLEFAERVASADGIGRANLILSVAAQFMGDRAEARMRAERALAAFEKSGDLVGRSQATLAFLRMQPAVTPDTERLFERAIADAREAGDQIQEASAYHEGGDGLFVAGNYAKALSMLEQAAALYSKAGDDLNL
jgi:tetratricopeptide (TPR) repeat protein